jgi:hypothetical protein
MRPHAIHTLKRRATVFAAASAVATLVAACGLGPGKTPGGASLLITQNFGAQTIAQSAKPKIVGADTVMRVLERNANVTTRYGGGFVESIDGHSGGSENGQPADWFYYVNGVQGGKGAAATKVHSGDQIWWDRHIWTATESIPAVVGAFPEPFLDGYGGTRYPTRIECTQTKAKACTAVYNTLAGYGLPVGLGCLDCAEYNMSLRVLVGPFSTLAVDATADLLRIGPSADGIYARFIDGGRKLELLDQQGRVAKTLGAGAGLVAATRLRGAPPVWFVTGTNAAGVAAAEQAFNSGTLDGHFAVAVANYVAEPLPLAPAATPASGQSG